MATGVSGDVTLFDNGEKLTFAGDSFAFTQIYRYGTEYDVIVANTPEGIRCFVDNGAGTVTSDVSDVAIHCFQGTSLIYFFLSVFLSDLYNWRTCIRCKFERRKSKLQVT